LLSVPDPNKRTYVEWVEMHSCVKNGLLLFVRLLSDIANNQRFLPTAVPLRRAADAAMMTMMIMIA